MVEETKRNVILRFAKPKCLFRTTFRKKTKNEEEKKKKEEDNERKKWMGIIVRLSILMDCHLNTKKKFPI